MFFFTTRPPVNSRSWRIPICGLLTGAMLLSMFGLAAEPVQAKPKAKAHVAAKGHPQSKGKGAKHPQHGKGKYKKPKANHHPAKKHKQHRVQVRVQIIKKYRLLHLHRRHLHWRFGLGPWILSRIVAPVQVLPTVVPTATRERSSTLESTIST